MIAAHISKSPHEWNLLPESLIPGADNRNDIDILRTSTGCPDISQNTFKPA